MDLFNKFAKAYYPKRLEPLDLKERRDEKLFISFLFVTQIILIIFIPLNFINKMPLAATVDIFGLFLLILISIFYRYTSKLEVAFFCYIVSSIILVSVQHLIAPVFLYSNVIWLPTFLFCSFIILSTKYRYLILGVGIFFTSIAVVIHDFVPISLHDFISVKDAMTMNLIAIILSSVASAFITRLTITEEGKIKDFLHKKKEHFEHLHHNNAILTSMLTHDIATPLMIARQLIKKYEKDDIRSNKINDQLAKIESIINNARQFKALKDGKLKLTLSHVDLKKVCQSSIASMRARAERKNITIVLNAELDNYFVEAEVNSLESSVINNILTNALKFSEPNQKIDITITQVQNEIVLSIRDYGIGIPPKILSNLFDFSKQTSRRGTEGESGTGFGLPLVKVFVDIFNATINVDSRSDQIDSGSEFTIRFPIPCIIAEESLEL